MAMYATVVKGGKFTFTVDKDLARGLRPSHRNPRNEEYMITCNGALGQDGVLAVMEQLTRFATASVTDGFPFPQIFTFAQVIIVCGLKTIYEWDGTSLTLKYTAADAGGPWSAVDFYDYVYISNGKIAVIRDAASQAYTLSATQPHATAICNFNGQVLIGAPDADGSAVNIALVAGPITIELSQGGNTAW